ncbi:hypothetical protein GGX14DRAFT_407366 [Mycena pura]|uniref:Uncharacterized protein n=1 Tax=Mycena pura TaxID=153505 RepID=A0AAD6XX71_9AGAR|nr:hypothetical protein GGX14DRAFT_407366 [Mycena pura]
MNDTSVSRIVNSTRPQCGAVLGKRGDYKNRLDPAPVYLRLEARLRDISHSRAHVVGRVSREERVVTLKILRKFSKRRRNADGSCNNVYLPDLVNMHAVPRVRGIGTFTGICAALLCIFPVIQRLALECSNSVISEVTRCQCGSDRKYQSSLINSISLFYTLSETGSIPAIVAFQPSPNPGCLMYDVNATYEGLQKESHHFIICGVIIESGWGCDCMVRHLRKQERGRERTRWNQSGGLGRWIKAYGGPSRLAHFESDSLHSLKYFQFSWNTIFSGTRRRIIVVERMRLSVNSQLVNIILCSHNLRSTAFPQVHEFILQMEQSTFGEGLMRCARALDGLEDNLWAVMCPMTPPSALKEINAELRWGCTPRTMLAVRDKWRDIVWKLSMQSGPGPNSVLARIERRDYIPFVQFDQMWGTFDLLLWQDSASYALGGESRALTRHLGLYDVADKTRPTSTRRFLGEYFKYAREFQAEENVRLKAVRARGSCRQPIRSSRCRPSLSLPTCILTKLTRRKRKLRHVKMNEDKISNVAICLQNVIQNVSPLNSNSTVAVSRSTLWVMVPSTLRLVIAVRHNTDHNASM